MASLFDSRCGADTYTLESLSLAKYCGSVSGMIFTGLLTIIVLIGGIVLYMNSNKTKDANGKMQPDPSKKRNILYLIMTFVIIVLLWLILPRLSSYFAGNSWQTNQYQLKSYEDQGMTKQEAFAKLQQAYETKRQAQSTEDIASAILESKNRY